MNDCLDVSALRPEQDLQNFRIPSVPDEPVYSYLTRIMHLNPETDRARIVGQYFGSRNIRVENPLHAGFGEFAQHLNRLGANFCGDVVDEYSMLALFKPFGDPARYLHAYQLALGSRGNGMNELVGSRTSRMFRSKPGICLDCVRADQQHRPFANYRRSQQVTAVSHCAIHQTPLIFGCSSCGATFSHWDLPSLKCHHCGETHFQVEDNPEAAPVPAAQIRLSKVVAAVFSGKISAVDAVLRLDVLRKRTEQIVRTRSGVVGDNLATHLNRLFGRSFLASLGLQTQSAPTLGWPALLIHGRFMVHDPIANCILIAALFDSVDHYIEAINAHQTSPENLDKKPKPLLAPGNISFSMLRDALFSPTLNAVIQQHGNKSILLKKWVAAYPGLSERRVATIFRRKKCIYKKLIQARVQSEPGLTRTQAITALKSVVTFVQKHEPQWLDQNLPVQNALFGAVASARFKTTDVQDEELCGQLADAVKLVMARRGRPSRLSMPNVIRLSGLNKIPDDVHDQFQMTLALAKKLCESMEEYYRRCLQWAAKDLIKQYGACDNLAELFVHAKVSLKFIKPLEQFARSLLDSDQCTRTSAGTK